MYRTRQLVSGAQSQLLLAPTRLVVLGGASLVMTTMVSISGACETEYLSWICVKYKTEVYRNLREVLDYIIYIHHSINLCNR